MLIKHQPHQERVVEQVGSSNHLCLADEGIFAQRVKASEMGENLQGSRTSETGAYRASKTVREETQ